MKSNEAIEPVKAEALAIPDYLKAEIGHRGDEEVGQKDLLLPRLGIAQKLSPQVDRKKVDKYIAGLEVGDFFDTATGEALGTKIFVVPIKYFRDFIQFRPLEDGGGIVARFKSEAEVPKGQLDYTTRVTDGKTENIRPVVTEFKNRLCMRVTEDLHPISPIIISAKASAHSTIKQWNGNIQKYKTNAYTQVYAIEATHRENSQFEWEGWKATFVGYAPEELVKVSKAFYESLEGKNLNVDYADETGEEETKSPNQTADPGSF